MSINIEGQPRIEIKPTGIHVAIYHSNDPRRPLSINIKFEDGEKDWYIGHNGDLNKYPSIMYYNSNEGAVKLVDWKETADVNDRCTGGCGCSCGDRGNS